VDAGSLDGSSRPTAAVLTVDTVVTALCLQLPTLRFAPAASVEPSPRRWVACALVANGRERGGAAAETRFHFRTDITSVLRSLVVSDLDQWIRTGAGG